MAIKILYIGDIFGSPGRQIFARLIPQLRKEWKLDAVIANAENAAAGRGLTPQLAEELLAAGADVLTLGDHAWDQKEIFSYLSRTSRVIRPANFAPDCPGLGWTFVELENGVRIAVAMLIGRVFMPPADCPFRTADAVLRAIGGGLIFAEIHAEATSEKVALGRYLDGRVTALVGTHTHVQTSDETIFPKGTAYITDLGMTGPKDSIIGSDVSAVLKKFITGMPHKFEVAENDVTLEGVLITADPTTGRAKSIKRIRER